MIDYLYYKLYKSYPKKNLGNIPEIFAAGYLSCLIFLDLIIINAFLAKINFGRFLISDSKQGGCYELGFFLITLLFYRKSKREIIINKYSQESEKERVRGNIFVVTYIVLTILMIFVCAFFKPGYLPSL